MKVLLLSLHHPELLRGGAQQVCYELFEGLKSRDDVKATLLCAVDSSAQALYKSGARITGFDGRPDEFVFLSRGYDYRWHRVPDPRLLEAYAEFLDIVRPDVVHVHHFLLFGLEILSLTRKILPDARIVFTLHEFLTICDANGHMKRLADDSLCDRPSPVRCHQCLPARAPEEFLMREQWVKRHLSAVDAFTTPSRFMIERFVRWGLPGAKMFHVPNGQRDYAAGSPPPAPRRKRNRFGFFGQLVDGKGVQTLLRAVDILRQEGFTEFQVEINGDNLAYASERGRAEIEEFLKREATLPFARRNVRFNGAYSVDQLPQRMASVDWCLVPSVWWETFALVISEAWMFGRPVIASDVGAMAERVAPEGDGLLFPMGDAAALAETMRRAATEPGLWERLSRGIRPPPSRESMVDAFVDLYRGKAPKAPAKAARKPSPEPAPRQVLEIRLGD